MSAATAVRPLLAGASIAGAASATAVVNDRPMLNFYGAGYLALSGIPEVRRSVCRALREGVPFARQWPHASGVQDEAFTLAEEAGARSCGTEASVYLPTGSLIGVAGLAAVVRSSDLLFIDSNAHFNLTAAACLFGNRTHIFAHCDPNSLELKLRSHLAQGDRPLVLTDGVFPTTGRIAPLNDYRAILEPFDGRILVDDAHGFGVLGVNGRGAAEHHDAEDICTTGVTLSKALCAQGALIGCTFEQAAQVRQAALIRGGNSGSPISAIAAHASLSHVAKHPEYRRRLGQLTDYGRGKLRRCGFEIEATPAPIIAFRAGSAHDMLHLQQVLFAQEIVIHYSNYIGAGPEGVIRCAVFRDHCEADFDRLAEALSRT